MQIYIALFRGINVGGNNVLPMKELRLLLTSLGLQEVKTYIQSGNVVFKTTEARRTKLSTIISDTIHDAFGFRPWVLLLRLQELEKAIDMNPFPEIENPSRFYLYFTSSVPPKPHIEKLRQLKTESEEFQLIDNIFYLHAPDGIGRSKLAARVEQLLDVPVTSRNWRTIQKIYAIACN